SAPSFRLIGLRYSRRRRNWLGLAIGCNREATRLHLVRLFAIALMPHGSNLCLLALLSACLGNLGLSRALLLDVRLNHLRRGASGKIAMLTFFQQHRHHDLGIAARRDADKPAVVLEVRPC